MDDRKKVIVVDDDDTVRKSLALALRLRGFDAEEAGDVASARGLIQGLGSRIDVMVLDMRLEDRRYPSITGADLGLEAREAIHKWPPEFLILSGYAQSEYYEAALKLDAAAYLVKGKVENEDVVRHIRSLSLRRALSFEREEIERKIAEIAGSTLSPAEAIAGFCLNLLAPEMRACIGCPSVFLLTDEKGTLNCGGDAGLPSGYQDAYAKVQALAQGAANNSDPFVLEMKELGTPCDQIGYEIYRRLDGAAFLPLFIVHGLRLSVGILKSEEPHQKLPEDPVKLARILISYLRPAIIEHLLRILSLLTESNAQRDTMLRHTSRFCRWMGQEQLAILEEASGEGELDSIKKCLQNFKSLSEDLRLTGEFLSPLALKGVKESDGITRNAGETIQDVWREVTEQFDVGGVIFEGPEAPFSLPVAREDLFLSALRVLQWMTLRKDRISDGDQKISVSYSSANDCARIIFTDRSRRLRKSLREMLFEPFTQANLTSPPPKDKEEGIRPGLYLPLFLAKMLVEVKYTGSLRDASDDLEAPNGHRFVMSFPIKGESRTMTGSGAQFRVAP
jgi:DNA-binding NarL/FixJ family response regulator